MKTSIFCTTATTEKGTGGGRVSYHELLALKRATEVKKVLSQRHLYPPNRGLTNSPFLIDYLAFSLLGDIRVDVAMFNGNPFGLTANKLQRNGTKIIVDVPAHNLEVSVEEFRRRGFEYPHKHMTDPFLWSLYTRHIKNADVVLCPSRLSADYIMEKLDLKKDVVVIPHGCDLPPEAPDFPERFTVGHLGINGPDKGQAYLVQAWRGLSLKDASAIIAGYGTEVWGPFCIGLGYISEVPSFYKSCTIYVQPSVTEGFGMPVLEVMANGRSVIVTEGVGASELVEDGKDGFVVPIRDPKAIAEKILYFYNSPSEVDRMGRNARQKAMRYTWDKIEKQYEDLYLEGS